MKDKEKKYIDPTVRSYLARNWKCRNWIDWDEEKKAWKYPIETALYYNDDETQEDLDKYARTLPLNVPGLKVVDSILTERKFRSDRRRGYVWFTWSRKAMWNRIEEVFKKYGVADERLDYIKCSGKIIPENGQLRLPGIIEQNERAYTVYGLKKIDHGFCHRILQPNKGGPEAIPFESQRCIVGNEWWYVGSKGDSLEIMTHEIMASPLDARTQDNLLYNLKNHR